MKEIQLTNGKISLVDDEIYDIIKELKWHYSSHGYAQTTGLYFALKDNPKASYIPTSPVKLHHIIIGQPIPNFRLVVDHINRNKLDNRKENLRLVTCKENVRNRGVCKNSKSGVTGIYWNKELKKWRSFITVDGKYRCLGFFTNFEEAVRARKSAELL